MPKPRISLNKLGEYLTATPSRRRRIVLDQKNPEPFLVARYKDAREAIVRFLESRMADEDILIAAANQLRVDEYGTDFARQDRLASAEAIDNFSDVADQIEIEDLAIDAVDSTASTKMEIAGVDVSIRPDVYLLDPVTHDIVGAVKLHFPKTTPLDERSAGYVATALYRFLSSEKNAVGVRNDKCYVVDVSTQSVFHARRAYKRNMSDITAACEEVRARWLM